MIDDEGLITFLSFCAEKNMSVLVHPWDMLGKERLNKYMMGWTVGMMAETQLSIVAMILGGSFDKIPASANLKLCFAHGGGSFAFLLGRLENAWTYRDLARGKSQHPPSFYLDRFHVDSAVFDDDSLDLLVKKMSGEHVMLGSDYPFPLGEQQIGSLVANSPYLSEETKENILYKNASSFFNIPVTPI